MKKVIIVAFVGISFFSFAQNANKKVSELLSVMGTRQNMVAVLDNMIDQYKSTYPNVPAEFWGKVVNDKNIDSLIEKLTPLYTKYYTEKEIEDLTAFYKSPTGKKMVETMPDLMKESMAIGQKWGTDLATEITQEIERENKYQSPPPPMSTKSK